MLLQKEIGIFRENMKCLVESNWNRGVVGPMFFFGGGGQGQYFSNKLNWKKNFRTRTFYFIIYTGMLDYEDSDNITNFPTGLNNRGAMAPQPSLPPALPAPSPHRIIIMQLHIAIMKL
jgi:hypothetical protein